MSTSDSMPKFKPLSNSNYPEWCGDGGMVDEEWTLEVSFWKRNKTKR